MSPYDILFFFLCQFIRYRFESINTLKALCSLDAIVGRITEIEVLNGSHYSVMMQTASITQAVRFQILKPLRAFEAGCDKSKSFIAISPFGRQQRPQDPNSALIEGKRSHVANSYVFCVGCESDGNSFSYRQRQSEMICCAVCAPFTLSSAVALPSSVL